MLCRNFIAFSVNRAALWSLSSANSDVRRSRLQTNNNPDFRMVKDALTRDKFLPVKWNDRLKSDKNSLCLPKIGQRRGGGWARKLCLSQSRKGIEQCKNGVRTACWSSMSTHKANLEDWAQTAGLTMGWASCSASSERVPKNKPSFPSTHSLPDKSARRSFRFPDRLVRFGSV